MLGIKKRINLSKYIQKIPFTWKLKLKRLLHNNSLPAISRNSLKIIVAMAADYGNLGDIAITLAQINFLMDHFPDYEILPIYVEDFYMLPALSKLINYKDIITLIGGGNMGDVYEGLEERRRYIINQFPNNKIISFPQSIDFKGIKSLNKSKKVYSKHQNLHIFSREPQSFQLMKEYFKSNHVYLAPDIVLYLNHIEPKLKRDGIILCLRNDFERKISTYQKESLIFLVKEKYDKVISYDTYLNNFSVESAKMELANILEAFKKSKVVVTDRLHGMIFCAITKTPCVVLPNSNHKIVSTYKKWLTSANNIIFIENFDEEIILDHINIFYQTNIDHNDIELDFRCQYESLLEALKH